MSEPRTAIPSDAIVGSWRLPAPVRHVPGVVWLFVVATLADAVLRSLSYVDAALWQTRPAEAAFVVLTFLPNAAWMFLPAAVLLGRWTGRRGRLVLAGALLIAGSEAASLAVSLLTVGPFGAPAAGFPEMVVRLRSVDG